MSFEKCMNLLRKPINLTQGHGERLNLAMLSLNKILLQLPPAQLEVEVEITPASTRCPPEIIGGRLRTSSIYRQKTSIHAAFK